MLPCKDCGYRGSIPGNCHVKCESERIIGSLRQQLATTHTERDVLRQRLEAAHALLREACIGYENAHDYSGDKRLRLVPFFVAWYERAKEMVR